MCPSSRTPRLPASTPGPCPWYFGPDHPPVRGCSWEQGLDEHDLSGAAILVRGGKRIAVVPMYSYVQPLGAAKFLVWGQDRAADHDSPVVITWLDATELPPLTTTGKSLGRSLSKKWVPVYHEHSSPETISIPTIKCRKSFKVKYPAAMQSIEELFILCRSTGAKFGKHGGSLALLHARPASGDATLHPQRWFNEADRDFGYEWVTRVGRHPKSGRVCGDGIRIGDFVLDGTLEDLAAP